VGRIKNRLTEVLKVSINNIYNGSGVVVKKNIFSSDDAEISYLRSRLPDYLLGAGYPLTRAFHCINPEHPDHHPSMRYWAAGQKVKCFSCGACYDIFDVIEARSGLVKGQGIPEAKRIYGVKNGRNKVNIPRYTPQAAPVEEPVIDGNTYVDVTGTEAATYLTAREITAETIEHFKDKLQYCAEWRHPKAPQLPPTPRLIIRDEGGYVARLIRDAKPGAREISKQRFGSWGIFNVEALTAKETVFVTEGAIDAMTLFQLGAPQVLAMGSATAIDVLIDRLTAMAPETRPPAVVIAADNDTNGAGRVAADILGAELKTMGIPYHIHNNWGADKGGKEYKDANEGMMNHGGGEQGAYFDFVSEPLRMVKEATVAPEATFTETEKEIAVNEKRELAPGLVPLSTITPEETQWLWPGYLVQGELNSLCGRPDVGKSFLAMQIATAVSSPDGKLPVIPSRSDDPETVLRFGEVPHGDVLYLSGDDSNSKTLHKRFSSMGADLSKIHVWEHHQIPAFDSPKYGEMFEKVKPALVVFDTFQHFFTGDMNKANDTTEALHCVLSLIRQYNACGLVIMHINKLALTKQGCGDALAASTGSLAIQGKYRSSLSVGFTPEFDGKTNHTRALCHTKGNLVETGKPASLLYEIKGGAVSWLRVDHVLQDHHLYGGVGRVGRPNQRETAKEFIEEYLDGGMKPADEVKAAAESAGIKRDLFYKAARELGGKYERVEGVSFLRVGECG